MPVDIDDLKNGLRADPHKVPKAMRNQLIAKHPSMSNLDDGEKDLYAYLFSLSPSLPGSFLVSTADKGAIVAAHKLNWLDNLVALESMLRGCGVPAKAMNDLLEHYRLRFLDSVKTQARFGFIP